MTRLTPTAVAALAFLALPGCIVYADEPGPRPLNDAPEITYADASCGWDDYYWDDVWFFDADVADADGDVVEVFADVYDAYSGQWVDGFPLDWEVGGTWSSAWVGSSTYLACGYPDYVVDFTAIDSFGASDVVTTYPWVW